MSIGIGATRPVVREDTGSQSQLLEMVQSLAAAVARLESKLEGKEGKGD